MPVKGRFSLDTIILIYAVDRDAGERHAGPESSWRGPPRATAC